MILTRHAVVDSARWAVDGRFLPVGFQLGKLLSLPSSARAEALSRTEESAEGRLLPPIEPDGEVWASGVTYRRSLVEREAESIVADVYGRVYDAERPEIFFKAVGHRVVGEGESIRIRGDSAWNVPEPELTLVLDSSGAVAGYTAGNDVSSRSIEGENPLYLPQAKCYDGACALGPAIVLMDDPGEQPIALSIVREGQEVFAGKASTGQMKRRYSELAEYLFREMSFPLGAFLMTGTGIVPGHDFTLLSNDEVRVQVGELTLSNDVA